MDSVLKSFNNPDVNLKCDELFSLCDDPMSKPVQMIDKDLNFLPTENLNGYLIDNTGFLVVGIIGRKCCGKSSIGNLLSNQIKSHMPPQESPFNAGSIEDFVKGYPTTKTIDVYVTQDRIIILDCFPVLCSSIHMSESSPFMPEIVSLQMTVGPQILRTHLNKRACEAHVGATTGNKPGRQNLNNEESESTNKTDSEIRDTTQIKEKLESGDNNDEDNVKSTLLDECLQVIDEHERESKRRYKEFHPPAPEVFVENSDKMMDGEELKDRLQERSDYVDRMRKLFLDPRESIDNVRFMLLPETDEEGNVPIGCPSYGESAYLLHEAVVSTPRQHMVPNMTEKEWLQFAEQMWLTVRDSSLIEDYKNFLNVIT